MSLLHTLHSYLSIFPDVRSLLIGFIVFLVLAWMVHGYLNRVPNLPPGPTSWPLIGCLPQFVYLGIKHKDVYEMTQVLVKKYGSVCYIPLPFGIKIVFISGYDAVNESLTCSGFGAQRPPFSQNFTDNLLNGEGIIDSSGETWREHRKFTYTVLRGFGVGKRSFEDHIATESAYLLTEIESRKSLDPTDLLYHSVSNIICSVVFGKRFENDDPEFKKLLRLLQAANDFDDFSGLILLVTLVFMPALTPYLTKLPLIPKHQTNALRDIRQKFQDVIDKHRDTIESDDMRDYIDVYLRESQKKREQGVHTYLSDIELRAVVQDLFLGGTETTSSTLRWAILYMMKFPDVQNRVQEEIDSVVGRDRLPRLSDKPNLPYTQAVIHEIQRYGNIIAFVAPRYSNQNTKFHDFTIPKGSYIASDLHSITRDTSIWDEPEVFKPERFLDDEGQVVNPSHHIPFGAGKRACLGEQLARMELYIFYTHLMHRFSFKKPTGVESVDINPKLVGILTPRPYQVCATVR